MTAFLAKVKYFASYRIVPRPISNTEQTPSAVCIAHVVLRI